MYNMTLLRLKVSAEGVGESDCREILWMSVVKLLLDDLQECGRIPAKLKPRHSTVAKSVFQPALFMLDSEKLIIPWLELPVCIGAEAQFLVLFETI